MKSSQSTSTACVGTAGAVRRVVRSTTIMMSGASVTSVAWGTSAGRWGGGSGANPVALDHASAFLTTQGGPPRRHHPLTTQGRPAATTHSHARPPCRPLPPCEPPGSHHPLTTQAHPPALSRHTSHPAATTLSPPKRTPPPLPSHHAGPPAATALTHHPRGEAQGPTQGRRLGRATPKQTATETRTTA